MSTHDIPSVPRSKPRKISIFGATGSIGQSTLDLIAREPECYDVIALTGGRNIAQLAQDARRFYAKIVVTAYDDCFAELKEALADTDITVGAGDAAIIEAAMYPTDWAMSAIVGVAGLAPGLETLKHGGILALANKESLVAAGALLKRDAEIYGAKIIPVDSEHSAIFQALKAEKMQDVSNITLTASGGGISDMVSGTNGKSHTRASQHTSLLVNGAAHYCRFCFHV